MVTGALEQWLKMEGCWFKSHQSCGNVFTGLAPVLSADQSTPKFAYQYSEQSMSVFRGAVCVCVCVCVKRERERERERQCVCVCERERESVCVWERECVCERERESVCVCVREWERERVCVRESERVSVCVRERESERVCVWERERVCVCVCVWEREREWANEWVSVCVCERERESVVYTYDFCSHFSLCLRLLLPPPDQYHRSPHCLRRTRIICSCVKQLHTNMNSCSSY